MNYRILFLVSIIIFVSLSTANILVLSSGRIQIGTPTCSLYNDQSGTKCASISCNGSEPTGSTCYDDQNSPTHLSEQSRNICVTPLVNCQTTEPLACDSGNKSASYGRVCNGTAGIVTSRAISCPLSCTSPAYWPKTL